MCDKTPWNQFVSYIQEDEAIENIVAEFDEEVDWKQVEQTLKTLYGIKNRSAKQCRERWLNNLDPNCKKKGWTEEEENIIFTYQRKVGNNWSKIAQFLVDRSENTIKNHFYATIRRKVRIFNKNNSEKIEKPLKEIFKDQELMNMLISLPEKLRKETKLEL